MNYKAMWQEQVEWLERVRDAGMRTKAMAALFNMRDIEERESEREYITIAFHHQKLLQ